MAPERGPRASGRAGLVLAVLSALPCAALSAQEGERIVVGSKSFAESSVLGEMLALLLEERGFRVEHRSGLGGTLVCYEALRRGEIDLYPEYTGTGWAVLLGRTERMTDPLETYLTVARLTRAQHDVEWLDPLGPNDTYALALSGPRARALGIRTLSELGAHAAELSGGFSLEFLNRADGYPGLAEHYGLALGSVKGMEHALAYAALAEGALDVVDVYSTDGELLRYDLVVLEDDRRFFPPYDVAPIVRGERLRASPAIREALEPLAFRIDDARMRGLNHAVQVEHRPAREIARAYLVEEGLIGPGTGTAAVAPVEGFAAAFLARADAIPRRLGEHVRLTLVSVLLATLLAVPLGVVIARRPWARRLSLGLAGIAQTIPSLALLACLISVPGLGLRPRSAVVALTLYALLPILRNTITGLVSVDPEWTETARALGLSPRQVLLRVELPLALRTILAGVRTAAVVTVGFATLAAFIGAGGLGEPILTGLYLADVPLILTGAIPAALLALVVDLALGRLELALTPRGLRSAGVAKA